MFRHGNVVRRLGCLLVCMCPLAIAPLAAAAEPSTRPAIRVGTFDPRAVALAYYRSPLHNQRLAAMEAEHKKAKDAGNADLAKKLESAGQSQQERAHQQTFGTGPYDSLADDLAPLFPQIGDAAGVDVIVPKVFYATPNVRTTDVTPAIFDALKADEKTRRMIQDLQEKIRTGAYDPATYKGGH